MNVTIPDLAALLASLGALYFTWRKTKSEIRGNMATADENEAGAVVSAAQAVKLYADEIVRLRGDLETLRCQIDNQKTVLDRQQQINAKLIDWTGRLAAQVVSLGGIPVITQAEINKLIGVNDNATQSARPS